MAKFAVEVITEHCDDLVLAVEWEWKLPAGWVSLSPVGTRPGLVIRITRMDTE